MSPSHQAKIQSYVGGRRTSPFSVQAARDAGRLPRKSIPHRSHLVALLGVEWKPLGMEAGGIDFQRVGDFRICGRGGKPVIYRIVVEKAKVMLVRIRLQRAPHAGFGGVPEDEAVAVVSNDEQPVF